MFICQTFYFKHFIFYFNIEEESFWACSNGSSNMYKSKRNKMLKEENE